MTVSEYLSSKNIEWHRRGENAVANCPLCGDTEQKFAIHLAHGAWNCLHLDRCGRKGTFRDLQLALGDEPATLEGHDNPIYRPKHKKSYKIPKVKLEGASFEALEWLHKRGISDDTIDRFSIGYNPQKGISFPYYRDGKLVNVKYRTFDKKFSIEEGAEPILFGRDLITESELNIVEGEMDVMAMWEYGIQAVSVPMGAGNHQWVDNEWDFLDTFDTVYLCLDQDEAGQKATMELANRIGLWKCKVVKLPHKDANECLICGVDKVTINTCFLEAKEFKPDTLANAVVFEKEVTELFARGGELVGIKTPWSKLDGILRGWRPQEVTIWSGKNSSGKSTALNQVLLDLSMKGESVCIYSGELPAPRLLRWAVIQHLGTEHPEHRDIISCLEWLGEHLFIVNVQDEIDPAKLLADFEYAARRYGCRHFIVDSLMTITLGGDEKAELTEQKNFVKHLKSFSKKFQAHIHLVAHPRKTQTDDDEPGKVDISGSANISNLADNVIILFRYSAGRKEKMSVKSRSMPDMALIVKKNREYGTEGYVNMSFDPRTKKFADIVKEQTIFGTLGDIAEERKEYGRNKPGAEQD